MDNYKTVEKEAQDEFIEKRSRFIGYCKPVTSEEEAIAFINEKKSKHWDAKHNVYAYSLRNGQIKRYSDDGEPQGTAGVPTLDVIEKSGVTDVVVVVTRYFGGILLGGGGLVRAYSNGARIALNASHIITMKQCCICSLSCNYNQYGKISSLVPMCGGVVDDTQFTDDVKLLFHIEEDIFGLFEKQLADATCGDVSVEVESKKYFSVKEK